MTTTPLPPFSEQQLKDTLSAAFPFDAEMDGSWTLIESERRISEAVIAARDAQWQDYTLAARADLETEVQRLKQAAEELSFLYGDLLLWTEWAVDKGNANSDLEEAWERYEEWLKARAALEETP